MWPFSKKQKPITKMMEPQKIGYTQADITERFGDNLSMGPDDWIETVPLNARTDDPVSVGLAPVTANEAETYEAASKLSAIREKINIPEDGVYCPVCHVANISLGLLRQPCPKCGRPLLQFGWD
jgi:hypothetical protein